MSVEILYNGQNPFGTRTPFVSRDYSRQEVNGFISGINRLTLSGSRPRPNQNAVVLATFIIVDSDGDSVGDSDDEEIEGISGSGLEEGVVIDSDGDEVGDFEDDPIGTIIDASVSGCFATFEDYYNDMTLLKSYFALQFKPFQILENSVEIFYHPSAKIISINFPESQFSSFYRYEIVIDCIDSYNNAGILDPSDEWSASSDEKGTYTLTHTVSARGVGEDAFQRAKDFVLDQSDGQDDVFLLIDGSWGALTSIDTEDTPSLVDEINRRYALISRKTFLNRLTGEVRMTETWLYNPEYTGAGYGFITYETSYSQTDGVDTVEISGEIQVSRVDTVYQIDTANDRMIKARITFDTIDFQAIAQQEYQEQGGVLTLASASGVSISENAELGTVSFTLSWNSLNESSPYIIDTSTVLVNKIGGPNCFRYSGRVKSDSKCQGTRFNEVEAFFESVNWEERVLQKWAAYGTGETLTANAKSKSVSRNMANAEVSVSVEYCAEPEIECGSIEAFKYTMTWTPSIEKYSVNPILNGRGYHDVQDLGFKNRKGFSITGSARRVKCATKESAIGELKSRINMIMVKSFPGFGRILLQSEINEDKTGDFLSFSYAWNANAD